MALAVAMALASMTLGGCAGAESTIGVDSADHVAPAQVSQACSWAIIFEWDGTPGPATRAEAIREMLENYEQRARALPVDAPRDRPGDSNQDPVHLAVLIRALHAALASLPKATQGAENRSDVEFSAFDDAGTELAHIVMAHQRSGGYRVEQLHATGFTSDHPTCT